MIRFPHRKTRQMDRTDLIQWGLIGLLLVGLVYVVFALPNKPKKYWYKIEVDDGFKWQVGLYDSHRGAHSGPFEDLYECIDDMNNYLANLQKPTIIQVSKNDLKLEGVVKL